MRTRRLLVLLAALVIAGVLVAPVVLTNQGGTSSHCQPHLRYMTQLYERRSAPAGVTQSVATGVGVLSGCGQTPTNVNVRSMIGIDAARAVVIDNDKAIYVRAGVCGRSDGAQLRSCLTR